MKMSIDFNHFRLQLYSSSSSELTSQKFIDGTIFLTLQHFFHFLFNGRANSTSSQLFAGSSSSAAKNRFLVLNIFLRLEETKKNVKKISDRKFLHFDFRRRRKDFILGKTTLRVFFAIPAGDSIEYWRTLVHGV